VYCKVEDVAQPEPEALADLLILSFNRWLTGQAEKKTWPVGHELNEGDLCQSEINTALAELTV